MSNLFKRETLSGEFLQVNAALARELKARGLWTPAVREAIKRAEGSVQGVDELPDDVRRLFRTAWELPQRALIDMAAERSPYIDQSQSLNLFIAGPTIGEAVVDVPPRLEVRAEDDLLPALAAGDPDPADDDRAVEATAGRPSSPGRAVEPHHRHRRQALACSLENPESCEACQ